MSYESPIKTSTETIFENDMQNITDSIIEQTKKRFENEILKHITLQTGIKIDRDELIKALEYDRNQYEKGYADGQKDAVRHARWTGDWDYFCSCCNEPFEYKTDF